jgi:hypothetical protein
MALAHKLDGLIRNGTVKSHIELAVLGRVSPARSTQILMLLNLAPAIQEYLLFLSAGEGGFFTEAALRDIAREPCWNKPSERLQGWDLS